MKRYENSIITVMLVAILAVIACGIVVVAVNESKKPVYNDTISNLVRSCSDISLGLEQVADKCVANNQ